MGQITSGVRSVLSHPRVYDALQRFMGGHIGRSDFAATMVRAAAGTRVLDIGCGTGDLLRFLPDGVEYHGWDISGHYIAAARSRFGGRGTFVAGTLTAADLSALPPFDVVIASAVLHHFDDQEAAGLVQLARLALRAGGRFTSIDPVRVPGQHPMARFLIARDRGQHVRTPDGYLALVRDGFARPTGVLRHRRWVPYTHWMMEVQCLPWHPER